MITALFDDHYETFLTWREAGLKDLLCLHIDSHLDVMEDGFSEQALALIEQARSGNELSHFRSSSRGSSGILHCGNFLFPALKDGTVSELIWLLPPHILKGDCFLEAVRQQLVHWVDLPLSDYASLVESEGVVRGTLYGRSLTVCTSETLPSLNHEQQKRLALDIDVDYFVRARDDELWQTPHELHTHIGPLRPVVLTVAISREGGYTPLKDQYLGQVCCDVFSKDPTAWREEVSCLRELDSQSGSMKRAGLHRLLDASPTFLQPAVLVRLERMDEAEQLNPIYQDKLFDRVARLMEQKRWQQALICLGEPDDTNEQSLQLCFFCRLRTGDVIGAIEVFQSLLALGFPHGPEHLKILQMAAQAYFALEQFESSVEIYQKALSYDRFLSSLHLGLAGNWKALDEPNKATRSLRKALRLSRGRYSSLAILADASRWYEEMGLHRLAAGARQELQRVDVTGRYAMLSRLEHSRRNRTTSASRIR